VHELVHRIDLLTSPFGVGFHGRACLEFVGLQNDCATSWLQWRNRPIIGRCLSTNYAATRTPSTQVQLLFWQGTVFRLSSRGVEASPGLGWGGDVAPLQVLGRDLHKVMIHEQSLSIAIPDADGEYVRPLTILESRALSVTALNLFYRLVPTIGGGRNRCIREDILRTS